MTIIIFEAQERDCPYNRNRIGRPIVDHKVLIDGEHRATFLAESGKRSYRLHDAVRQAIHLSPDRYTPPHLGDLVPTKAAFRATVEEYLAAGRIPTTDKLAAARADREAVLVAQDTADLAARRNAKIRRYGVKLYECLRELVDTVDLLQASDMLEIQTEIARHLLMEIDSIIREEA